MHGQHTDEPLPDPRPDNLWQPVPGDHGAHGRFDDSALDFSLQYWLTTHRPLLAAGAVALLALAGLGLARW